MKRFQSAIAVLTLMLCNNMFAQSLRADMPMQKQEPSNYASAQQVINQPQAVSVAFDQSVVEQPTAEEVSDPLDAVKEEALPYNYTEPVVPEAVEQQGQTQPQQTEEDKELEKLKAKIKEIQERQGRPIQKSMIPEAPTPAKPIEISSNLPAKDAASKEISVAMPSMCENLGLLLAGMDAAKTVQGKLGMQAVNDMFADIDAGKTCPERLQKLSHYVDLNIIRPYPVKAGPLEKEIITNPGDWRLAAYNIGYGQPFTHWSQQRVAQKELKTLQDYLESEQVLLDHIQYFKVPANRADLQHLAPKVEKMKGEMPDALRGCLHESWRWAPDVKLCQWMDGRDTSLWVNTWASSTLWGVVYHLLVDRDAPMLVAYLPESEEFVFWAGPCGGNGGWLPSGSKASFRIDVRATDCDKITGSPLKFTSDSEQGQYKVQLGTQGKPVEFKDVEIRNSEWKLLNIQGESFLGTGPEEVLFTGSKTVATSENILRYTAESRMKPVGKDEVVGEWHPMTCYLTLAKELPAPKVFPLIQCASMEVRREGKRIYDQVKIDNPDNMKYTVVLMLNGVAQKTTLEKNGSYSFVDPIPANDYSVRYLTAELRDENGQQFRDEKGNALTIGCFGQDHLIQNPPPPPVDCKCKSLKASESKLKRNELDQLITLTPKLTGDLSTLKSAVWTKQDGSLIDKKFVNPETFQLQFRAGQLLPTEQHNKQMRLQAGKTTFVLTVTSKDETVTECRVTVTVTGSSIWPWLLLAAIVIAVVVIIIITHGAAAPVATKIAIPVKGVLFPITIF